KLHEQHDLHIARWSPVDLLADGYALQHLGKLFHLPINLRCPNAHPAGIQRGVAPAIDDVAAIASHLGPVTVPPYAGEIIEARGAILGAIRIIPELDRHAGERLGTDQL